MEMNPYTWALILTALLSASIAFSVWRRRPTADPTLFPVLMVSLSWWSLTYGFELASTDLAMMRFWARIEYLGIATSPVFWLLFAVQYTGKGRWLTCRNFIILFLIPFITIALNATNEYHHLYFSSVGVDRTGAFPLQILTPGPGYMLHVAFSYLSIFVGALLLLHTWLRSQHVYRSQLGVMLIGISVPMTVNIFYLSGIRPFGHLDMTPLTFTITGLVVAFGLFRYKLLDLMPLARSVLVESLLDGIIVLDSSHRVVDINPAARKMLNIEHAAPILGQNVKKALINWPELVTLSEAGGKGTWKRPAPPTRNAVSTSFFLPFTTRPGALSGASWWCMTLPT
jgi:PAS domain-containing protein